MNLPKIYEPNVYENDIYALWEKSEAFTPKSRGSNDTYSIVMPPPNANANMHIGYALTAALEDIPARYHRMKGEATLLLPGADHAGFETQAVYEKHLAKEGKSRFDFTRDELYRQIWDFVELNRGNFESQLRALGASCAWDRYTFTLDDKIVNQAYETFKKMWDEGLIYRGERLVNYCTFHGTGFADIEVEYKDVPGHLWHIRYPLTDGSGEVVVATTRPETMLGDTAVAVHPEDIRYKKFHGKSIKLPLTNREVPIIVDDFVDPEFGSGAVKITPAHDPNDFDAAQRHNLPKIKVIDHEGKITHEMPEAYSGHDVNSARQLVVDDLESQGFLVRTDQYNHSVGHCYKCGTIIQPLLREQWFVDMKPLAKKAIQALRDDKIIFYPETKKSQLITYLKGLRDWNISRQIAWGIPIPAFVNNDDPDDWIFDTRVTETSIEVKGKTYHRDPDVFDTWFSSSSWPYATLDFPKGEDFKQFYPLSLMETGGEILYPWVSRMIMLGLYVTGYVPFKEVYIHGYVMAEDGSKMSKSIGNVIDPFPVIKQYGSDALRMGLINGRSAAVNRGYDQRKVEEARNFCNKLWNVARFVEDKVGDDHTGKSTPKPQTPADYWMLSKFQQAIDQISSFLDEYRFAEASEYIYHLLWDDFADWYIEASKASSNNSVLTYGLEVILKLTHPFAPFVTETIWQTLKCNTTNVDADSINLLATSDWPEAVKVSSKDSREFETIRSIVSEIRYITSVTKVHKPRLYHLGDDFITRHAELLKNLSGVTEIAQVRDGSGVRLNTTTKECWLDIDQTSITKFIQKLEVKNTELQSSIDQLEGRLKNKSYVSNAPKHLVEETKAQLILVREQIVHNKKEIDRFNS